MSNEEFEFFFQNLNILIWPEITESELKIFEPGQICKNIRMNTKYYYQNQNIQKFEISDLNLKGYVNAHYLEEKESYNSKPLIFVNYEIDYTIVYQ